MDATIFGAVLALVAALSGSVVAYLGKRAENANARWNAEMDQVQEERDGLRTLVAEKDARIAELLEQRLNDQVEIARLRVRIVELGGEP